MPKGQRTYRPPQRPMPDDFVETVTTSGKAFSDLIDHYRTGKPVMERWLKEAGLARPVPSSKKSPMPEGFAAVAGELSANALAKRFDISTERAAEHKRVLGHPVIPPPRHGTPADLAGVAPTMTIAGLAEHYGVGHSTISRWLKEVGVQARRSPLRLLAGHPAAAPMSQRDDSCAGQAADHLRRAGWTVYRARVANPHAPRDQWVVGNLRLRTDDMIAKAQRVEVRGKGFEPIYLGDVA